MSEHLSREEIENFITRDLASAEILRIDDHLAACAECMQMIERVPNIDAIRGVLESDEGLRHIVFDTMSRYVDGELAGAEHELAEVHLSLCGECANAVEELREMRNILATSRPSSVQLKPETGMMPLNLSSWWKFAVPVGALILLGLFVWALIGSRGPTEDRSNSSNTNSQNALAAQHTAPQTDSNIENSNVNANARKAVASLNDADGRIEIDSEGRISGISADQFEQRLRAALTNQSIDISSEARQLKTSVGTLMGPSAPGVPFRLIGPVGRVVEMDRPPFRWRGVQGADSYKVGVYDESFRKVAESPELKITTWTPGIALPRGRVYQWQVTAIVDGKEVVSPTRPAGEARFKIINAANAAEIRRARQTARNSRLLMGIVYANAGMIPEAEREFQALLQKNPKSEIARKLLAKVRNAK
jgi:hypothetical protein